MRRQGDVLLVEVEELPAQLASIFHNGRTVISVGFW
jgi:hypothetical protein